MPSTVAQVGPSWPGFDRIKHLVLFGASYCDIGYKRTSPHPTLENPLGVKFPGGATWPYVEEGKPNWVGHLIKMDSSHPKLAYDYAVGGDRVPGVGQQVMNKFLCEGGAGTKPDWAAWEGENTLFSTWIGINDVADVDQTIDELFEYQKLLYDAGARNFLFFDVPPIHRCPWSRGERYPPAIEEWNTVLSEKVKVFAGEHTDISALIFSSWDTFTRVLDDPVGAGFSVEDSCKQRGGIWYDDVHPTSRMHKVIAEELREFLSAIPSSGLDI
ncbi:hypothetical protein BV22DRAFT_1015030 [Leucogyrophana mollusca]|uniref:Uncharacterized protein n=1 Tax=Leucogyrophana mollusca TaxID=85980 RepID=A0ACB8BD47_9AGAM|nr:hypothetical protein BV22DRAFT_1015030 [Leucogyrophana mollusca]